MVMPHLSQHIAEHRALLQRIIERHMGMRQRANVRRSMPECRNGLVLVNLNRYHCTNRKSKVTGKPTNTGNPGKPFSHASKARIACSGVCVSLRCAAQASFCVSHHAIVLGCPVAPGKVSRLAENVPTSVLSGKYAAQPMDSIE